VTKASTSRDLLKRHAAGHPAVRNIQDGENSQQLTRDAGDTQSRVSTACQSCAACHLRCTESKPCRRCTEKGIECIWNQSMVLRSTPSTQLSQECELIESITQRFDADPSPSRNIDIDGTGAQGINSSQLTNITQSTQLMPPSGRNLSFPTSIIFHRKY
jgi:hypothetical protein